MSDVAPRLLAAIDEVERPELDARGDHELMWTMGDTAEAWHVECHHCGDWKAEGPEEVINPLADEHARRCVSMPVSPVLRLCQAHRDIVAAYVEAQRRVDRWPVTEKTTLRQAYVMARGYAMGLRKSVVIVARGYGVEDGET